MSNLLLRLVDYIFCEKSVYYSFKLEYNLKFET